MPTKFRCSFHTIRCLLSLSEAQIYYIRHYYYEWSFKPPKTGVFVCKDLYWWRVGWALKLPVGEDLSDMCPSASVRCFKRFLSVKVASNVKLPTSAKFSTSTAHCSSYQYLHFSGCHRRRSCHPVSLWSVADDGSLRRALLHPASFRHLQIQSFNPSVSTIFQCVVKSKIVEIHISILCCSYRPP